MKFNFWYRWLLAVNILFILIGLAIAFFPDGNFLDMHTKAIQKLFLNDQLASESFHDFRRFLYGIIGGTIAGNFLMQLFILWKPFYNLEKWAWHAVLWPMLLWFVVDSGLSIYHGAFFNVWMINIWTLILIGIPLIMLRRSFINKRRS